MTPLKIINIILLVVFLVVILLLIAHKFILAFILFPFLIYLSIAWYELGREDLIIYTLKRNANFLSRDEILERGPATDAVLKRLERKKIIEIKDNVIYLIKEDYKTEFERMEERSKKEKR